MTETAQTTPLQLVQAYYAAFNANDRDAMLALHEQGAQLVVHMHDDINLEVLEANAEGARKVVGEVMLTPSPWAKDFPFHTKPVVMKRYGAK